MYTIWNDTDDISATMERFSTPKEARKHIEKLRDSFRIQGYYRDNQWNKVAPDDILYRVVEIPRGNSRQRLNAAQFMDNTDMDF